MAFLVQSFALLLLASTPAILSSQTQLPRQLSSDVDEGCPAASGPAEDATYPIRKLAFDALEAKDDAAARRLMRCAVKARPSDIMALKQLVYLDLNAGDAGLTVEDIDALRAQHESEPQFEAQEGYIFYDKKQIPQARRAFERAAAGGNAAIRKDALRAIGVIDGEYPRRSLEIALDGQYLNRFDDGVVDTYARYFERLGAKSPFRAFAQVRLLRDTASQVGPLPQIFDDNAVLTGVGIAFQPHQAHYFLSGEANIAYAFFSGRNGTAATLPDFRAEAGYYNLLRPAADSAFNRFSFEANGSFGFYSRYQHDAIAYLQPQESFDVVRGPVRVSPFFQQSFAFDTNQQYYNNIAELIPGLQLSLTRYRNAALRVEYVRGYYLPFHTNSVNPYGSTYNDFRIRLTFDKSFFLHGAAQPEEPAAGAPH